MKVKCFLTREEVKFLACKYIMENISIKEEPAYTVKSENVDFIFENNWFDGIEVTIDAPSALEEPKNL
jgi:hypothetical protein